MKALQQLMEFNIWEWPGKVTGKEREPCPNCWHHRMTVGLSKTTPSKKQHQRLYSTEDGGGDGVGIDSTKITESLKNKQITRLGKGEDQYTELLKHIT